ncbi:MAG: hypothetical protein NC223_05410 [Butyrivibrio sp.]|nr:hypothetical protein [Butyrivibrio sp.]
MKIKKVIIVFFIILGTLFLVFGVPIIINECYKANCGYITVWDSSDVLGYYGNILGSAIAIITLVATILFTKKQLQRESFLKKENEKWERLKSVFLQTLNSINPMLILKEVMDNGFTDTNKAINILQKYQINCKTANDLLNAHLNIVDYPKFKELIDRIADAAEIFVIVSQKLIDQYSDLRILNNKDDALKMLKIENDRHGSFSKENIEFSKNIIEKSEAISFENIKLHVQNLNGEFVKAYEEKYRSLLQLIGSTFESVALETQQKADNILKVSMFKI